MTRDQLVVLWARRFLGRPFAWGETDCCALAAAWVLEVTGQAIPYRWGTEEEARTIFQETRPSLELQRRGWLAVSPVESQPGDIRVVETDDWPEQLHVVLGKHSLTSSLLDGVALVKTSALPAIRAWRAP